MSPRARRRSQNEIERRPLITRPPAPRPAARAKRTLENAQGAKRPEAPRPLLEGSGRPAKRKAAAADDPTPAENPFQVYYPSSPRPAKQPRREEEDACAGAGGDAGRGLAAHATPARATPAPAPAAPRANTATAVVERHAARSYAPGPMREFRAGGGGAGGQFSRGGDRWHAPPPPQQQQPRAFYAGGGAAYASASAATRPAGLANLGNTCYLNAVLQAVLGLPGAPAELRAAAAALGGDLPPAGALAALVGCAAALAGAAGSGGGGAAPRVAPAAVKRALAARVAAFAGALQHDAHEAFCALLGAAQEELLAVEAARLGRRRVRAGETADAATRLFGFAVEQELTCTRCGAASRVVEQHTHLSLSLPPGGGAADAAALLAAYFEAETIDKDCEGCVAAGCAHRARRSVRRLPRVLALHLKRFELEAGPGGVTARKLHAEVSFPAALRLDALCAPDVAPPLAPAAGAGKENGDDAAAAAAAAARTPGARRPPAPSPLGLLDNTPRVPAASLTAALLQARTPSTAGAPASAAPALRPPRARSASARGASAPGYWDAATPAARGGGGAPAAALGAGLADTEEADLQAAIAASLAACAGAALEGAPPPPPLFAAAAPLGARPPPRELLFPEIVEDDADTGAGAGAGAGARPAAPPRAAPARPPVYHLAALIGHQGPDAGRGHFVADVRAAGGGAWHRYDDALVRPLGAGEAGGAARRREAYMLFYAAA